MICDLCLDSGDLGIRGEILYDTEELGDGSLYIIQGEFFLHGLV